MKNIIYTLILLLVCVSFTHAQENETEKIRIYPNPYTEEFNLEYNVQEGVSLNKIVIRSIKGESLREINIQTGKEVYHVNREMSAGYYILELYFSDQKVIYQKILKEDGH